MESALPVLGGEGLREGEMDDVACLLRFEINIKRWDNGS